MISQRIRRLERSIGVLSTGHRRCKVCADGTKSTGVIINLLGVQQNDTPPPCPGCGRDDPMIINYLAAEDPRGAPPPSPPPP